MVSEVKNSLLIIRYVKGSQLEILRISELTRQFLTTEVLK